MRLFLVHSLTALLLVSTGAHARAATINMSANPLVTEMHVLPGHADSTSTDITNNGDTDERITVEPIDWTTRLDGSISIEPIGTEGPHSLTKYLVAESYRFILHPHEQRRLNVALSLPQTLTTAARSYWGGFIIKAYPLNKSLAIGPAATFFVYDDIGEPKRHVSISSLRVSRVWMQRSLQLIAHLKNDGSAYARTSGALVIKRGDAIVNRENIPVGVIFPGHDRIVEHVLRGLPRGHYTVEATFDYGGDVIVGGDTNFVVP
jgi:hypothetical protein